MQEGLGKSSIFNSDSQEQSRTYSPYHSFNNNSQWINIQPLNGDLQNNQSSRLSQKGKKSTIKSEIKTSIKSRSSKINSMERNQEIPLNMVSENELRQFKINQQAADHLELGIGYIEAEMWPILKLIPKDICRSIHERFDLMKNVISSCKASDDLFDYRVRDLTITNSQLTLLLEEKDQELLSIKKDLLQIFQKKNLYKSRTGELRDMLRKMVAEVKAAKARAEGFQLQIRRQTEYIRMEKADLLESLLIKFQNMGNIRVSPGNEELVDLIKSQIKSRRQHSDNQSHSKMLSLSHTPEDKSLFSLSDANRDGSSRAEQRIEVEEVPARQPEEQQGQQPSFAELFPDENTRHF